MLHKKTYKDLKSLLEKIKTLDSVMILNSNGSLEDEYKSYNILLASGSVSEITLNTADGKKSFDQFTSWYEVHKGQWMFGHLAYEANRFFEDINASPIPNGNFPLLHFFVPEEVMEISFESEDLENSAYNHPIHGNAWQSGVSKETYLEHIELLKYHIQNGDFYEINYCHPIILEDQSIDPFETYLKLNAVTKAPFSGFYKLHDQYLCCASPERFFKTLGSQIICQPIKGTNRRHDDAQLNEVQRLALFESEKERSENVMIVDLMRNDISRICVPGSVKVPELFGIYTFRQVNQMISTITGELRPEIAFPDIIKALFPMGSMTGAPKVSAMQQIAATEPYQRNLFSGTIGYIDPSGNSDFNVIIRSILYDDKQKRTSISAGGAITYLSDAEAEYNESLLKMEATRSVV